MLSCTRPVAHTALCCFNTWKTAAQKPRNRQYPTYRHLGETTMLNDAESMVLSPLNLARSRNKHMQRLSFLFVALLVVSPFIYVYTNLAIESYPQQWPAEFDVPETPGLLPTIYVITPTHRRLEQIADLTRLAQTLMLVPAVHWIVVEDNDRLSPQVVQLLARYPIPYTHLYAPMPEKYRKMKPPRPRGVSNRNKALEWLRENAKQGVFYFADDDNTYDIRLFEEMRYTRRVSMWPVGLIGTPGVSAPVVEPVSKKLIDFYDGWNGGRKFPVDMAAFAVNVAFFLRHPDATMPFKPGYEEDGFLKSLSLQIGDIEPKADGCSQILVWHTKTAPSKQVKLNATGYKRRGTNIDALREGIAALYPDS